MATAPRRNAAPPLYRLLVSLSLVLVFVVVWLSAYLRLADAGPGCADGAAGARWPDCFGMLGVTTAERPALSLAEGGPLLPHGAARSFHRLAAAVLGFLVFAMATLALRRGAVTGTGRAAPLLVFLLTVFLAVLGYLTPSPLIPAVTVANILGGLAMLALLWWMSQRALPFEAAPADTARALRPGVRLVLAVLTAQIALGAWVSGNFAGPACPQLLSCSGALSPDGLVAGFTPWRVLAVDAAGRVAHDAGMPAVHLVHRLGAVITAVILAVVAVRARRSGGVLRASATGLLVLLAAQFALGALNVAASLPLAAVAAHNALGGLLLLAAVNLQHRLSPGKFS